MRGQEKWGADSAGDAGPCGTGKACPLECSLKKDSEYFARGPNSS